MHIIVITGSLSELYEENRARNGDLGLIGTSYRRRPGVSIDPHKYGLTPKGLSLVLFRKGTIDAQHHQENIAEPRSYAQLCIGLHCLRTIGVEGYREKAEAIARLGDMLSSRLGRVEGIELITDPADELPHFVIAFQLNKPLTELTYSFASFMKKLGWQLSQVSGHRLHLALTNAHTNNPQFLDKFISDTEFVVGLIQKNPGMIQSASVGVYGMAAGLDVKGLDSTHPFTKTFLRSCVGLYAENLLSMD